MHIEKLVTQADGFLARKEDQKLRQFLGRQTPDDVGHIIEHLQHGKRKTFVQLPPEMQADVILMLSEHSRSYILPRLSDHIIARFLHFLYEDDAADILHELHEDRRTPILQYVKEDKRTKIEKLLRFGPETAGGLMDLNFITVQAHMGVKEVSDSIRAHIALHKHAPMVVVLDDKRQILGSVSYRTLMFDTVHHTVGDIVTALPVVASKTDQESVLAVATQEKSDVIGVTDDAGQIIGIIHLHDLLRVAEREATEDVYKFAGVSEEEHVMDPAFLVVRRRYKWLIVNLGTAFLAAFVVSLFQGTIERTAILAAYMPIVAGMGGNAGTQSLAVVVRGLALGNISPAHRLRIVVKEMVAGFWNGAINGVIVAVVIGVLTHRYDIGLILCAAMVINLVVAGLFGAIVPIILKWLKIDPAIASTVFVTTATDVCGFFAFLGLAALVLH